MKNNTKKTELRSAEKSSVLSATLFAPAIGRGPVGILSAIIRQGDYQPIYDIRFPIFGIILAEVLSFREILLKRMSKKKSGLDPEDFSERIAQFFWALMGEFFREEYATIMDEERPEIMEALGVFQNPKIKFIKIDAKREEAYFLDIPLARLQPSVDQIREKILN